MDEIENALIALSPPKLSWFEWQRDLIAITSKFAPRQRYIIEKFAYGFKVHQATTVSTRAQSKTSSVVCTKIWDTQDQAKLAAERHHALGRWK